MMQAKNYGRQAVMAMLREHEPEPAPEPQPDPDAAKRAEFAKRAAFMAKLF